jgi:hypothetical protein
MNHGLKLYEEAVRLHEKHAQDARKLGYEEMAKRAELRATAAKERAEMFRQDELRRDGPGQPGGERKAD